MKKIGLLLILFVAIISLGSCRHKHKYSENKVDATCTTEGYTEYSCTKCDDTYKENIVPALGHNFGDWTVVEEATEEKAGLKERTCARCNHKEEETIPQLEHVHKYTSAVTEPTCTEKGFTTHTCACGDSYNDSEVPALDHDMIIDKKVDATCLTSGLTEGSHCSRCDHKVEQEEIPALGHDLKDDAKVDATCTTSGKEAGKHCSRCDYTEGGAEIPATGHTYGEWVIIKEASKTEEGLKERTCHCGHKDEEVIPIVVPQQYTVKYDLNGGVFSGGYEKLEDVAQAFLDDFNKYSGTTATLSNFLKDSTASVKDALSNSEMLAKWDWLFEYMYIDLTNYNTQQGFMSEAYVSDTLDLLAKMKDGDTTVIKDGSKGPNFRTLVRSYLHGIMNESKGDQVNNSAFAKHVPDFSNPALHAPLLASQFKLEEVLEEGAALPVPEREYYIFKGWKDASGNIVSVASSNGTLTAVWEESIPVSSIEIINKITTISVLETYQLQWLINPSDAVNKEVKFSSSDPSIISVNKTGFISALKEGTVTITITSESSSGKSDSMTVNVIIPGHFEISYETNSYVLAGGSIKLNASYFENTGDELSVVWSSLNGDIASVDEAGNVTGEDLGVATIRATVVGKTDVYQDFVVTVVSEQQSAGLALVLNAHESNIYVEYGLPVGAGTPAYYADVFGSVSKLLFNDKLVLNTEYNKASNDKYGTALESRRMESIEFIAVHYTGNMNASADGEAHADYFAQPLSSNKTSIHYTTGNDGVYKCLDEPYRAAHAGDDGSTSTVAKFSWIDTPVEVLASDPKFPVVTITSNATFAINGRDTGVKVPEETRNDRGFVTDNKWLNDMGIAVSVKDGKYQLGTSWWCYTQISEGRICSNGGNANSIGIESAVNNGSDLWYTWHKTAQLVADIMLRNNLDITRVKGHHFFSAKDCPQPMLENELRLWWEFISLVEAEYEALTTAKDYSFKFSSTNNLLKNNGRLVSQPNNSTVVTYTVEITNGSNTETITLASAIAGAYTK